ncbi:MAG: hypothetical protein JWR24_1802 [Actinoallomurus sp.]|nr:hypothetical protein [Actinoallomurus sp.]
MGEHRGWIAAVLLITLVFIGGPDVLDTTPPLAQSKITSAESTETRDQRVRDDAHPQHGIADPGTPGRRWLPALPPSSQTHVSAWARVTVVPADRESPAAATDAPRGRHLNACSPATLQIFRC